MTITEMIEVLAGKLKVLGLSVLDATGDPKLDRYVVAYLPHMDCSFSIRFNDSGSLKFAIAGRLQNLSPVDRDSEEILAGVRRESYECELFNRTSGAFNINHFPRNSEIIEHIADGIAFFKVFLDMYTGTLAPRSRHIIFPA